MIYLLANTSAKFNVIDQLFHYWQIKSEWLC